MKQLNRYVLILGLFLSSLSVFGQADTAMKLSFSDYLQLVKENHPLAKQANLIVKSADANLLIARGSFDPKLYYETNDKFFNSKNYYQLAEGGFKIPTWFGIEFKGGFEQNKGVFLNPENTVPNNGLVFSQISIPLLQGLIIDERRATLKQAKIFQELSIYEKINSINELFYRAGKTYWDWQLSYANLQVHQNAVNLSQDRFEAIRKTSTLGDRPAIDTVEAIIQLQDRIINLQQALMDYRTKSLLLSNYLWLENNVPIEITNKTIPDEVIENEKNKNPLNDYTYKLDSIINNHPSLKVYDYKLKQLSIEKDFKQDKLKPSLNVKYSPLFNSENLNIAYQNNYKWGISFGFPVFLRKERGDLQLTKIKIDNITYENLNKRNELLNKIKLTINEFNTYKNLIAIYSKNVADYERLWKSEKQLFNSGESSLFMINSREMSYINAKIKLNEILNKNQKASLDVEYSMGLLNAIY